MLLLDWKKLFRVTEAIAGAEPKAQALWDQGDTESSLSQFLLQRARREKQGLPVFGFQIQGWSISIEYLHPSKVQRLEDERWKL